MRNIAKLSLLFITTLTISCTKKSQWLEINGVTAGVNTMSIVLAKPDQDLMRDSIIEIPVKNGSFHYKSKLENPEFVELYLGDVRENRGGRYMRLFLENEKIDLVIHKEDEFDKNIVNGGKLNQEYQKYKQSLDATFNSRSQVLYDSIDKLDENDEYFSDFAKVLHAELQESKTEEEALKIRIKLRNLKDGDQHLSSKAQKIMANLRAINKEEKRFQQKYIENNSTIVSYGLFIHDLLSLSKNKDFDVNWSRKVYQKLSVAHPNHRYNELALNLLNAIDNIKVGKKYVDFHSSDLNGQPVKFSDEIKGRITLLNLWSTWCNSCIVKSRTMIPVYNEYKDKGFAVIGVAGEYKNKERLTRCLEKENWPWLTWVELDQQNDIWLKYGRQNMGGGIFLIDSNGKILAIDPTAEEVRKELKILLD